MNINPNLRRKAFTLVEILLVCVIVSVVSLAIYSALNNGMKIWKRVNTQLAGEDAIFFLEKFSYDLRNSFFFRNINFTGTEEQISFASLVKSGLYPDRSIGQVSYMYNPQEKAVYRNQLDFSQIYSRQEPIQKIQLKNVSELKFSYYLFDPEKKVYFWQDELGQEQFPLAVKIALKFIDENKNEIEIQNTIDIPSAPR